MPSNNIIQFRRGSQSDWTNANPVLASGEPGFDTTNNEIRIGDGVSNWNSLGAIGASAQGIQGIQGNDGIQGPQGESIQGIQGTDGIQGINGAQGGSAIVTYWAGEYNGSTYYEATQGVNYNGGSYVALQQIYGTDPSTPGYYWQLIASQGTQGVQGEGIQGIQGSAAVIDWYGEYDAGTTYNTAQGVSYNGSSYVALQSVYGADPVNNPSYWQLIAAQGVQGIQGESIQGATGSDGAQGSAAAINWLGAYDSMTYYNENDGVSYNGSSYVALQSSYGNGPTNTSYWQIIASQGIEGKSVIWVGEYDPYYSYNASQGVSYNGSSYVSLQATYNEDPIQQPSYWQLIAAQGTQGTQGFDGSQGVQGPAMVVNFTGDYNSMTTYYENDSVSYNGSSYVAIVNGFNSIDPSNTSYWQLLTAQGLTGIQGFDGIQGAQGPAAVVNWTGEYNGGTWYSPNDGVSYNGSSYAAIQSTNGNDPTNTSYWQVVSAQGTQGIQGTEGSSAIIYWMGEYNGGTTYEATQGVNYNGGSYVALQSVSATDPASNPSYWQLIAAQGTNGVQGTDGSQGIQGIQGGSATAPEEFFHPFLLGGM